MFDQNKEAIKEAPANGEAVESNSQNLDDLLGGITNEDGNPKFASVEDALKSVAAKESHIQTLEAEAKVVSQEVLALRETATRVKQLEDTVSQLTATRQQAPAEPAAQTPVPTVNVEDTVKDLVSQELQQRQRESVAETNSNKVKSALIGQYGEKAGDVYAAKAAELNTTTQGLSALAQSNPDMVLAYFNSGTNSAGVTTGGLNVPLVKPEVPELQKPTKSMLAGATGAEQTEHLMQHKRAVYAKLGIQE